MQREHTTLENILRELVDKLQGVTVAKWNWNPLSDSNAPQQLPESKLLPSGPMHKNVVTELCVSVKGQAYLELKNTVVVLEPGQFLAIPAGTFYRECAVKGKQCQNLWLNFGKGPRVRVNITEADAGGRIGLVDTKMVMTGSHIKQMLLDTLTQELTGEQFGALTLVKSRLLEILIEMIRQLDTEEQGQFAHKWQETLVSETMDYLYRHGAEKTALQDVAEHLNISEKQLNRIFKVATGTTVINYFNKQRILQARYYLISTNLLLKDIAERLGYYDQYHFSRMFKKATTYTPSQFRKMRREE